MMIKSITIRNYRSINHLVLNDLSHLNIFIGKNGQGKSNIVSAIYNAVFSMRQSIINVYPRIGASDWDYHNRNAKVPIEISFDIETNDKSAFKLFFTVGSFTVEVPRLPRSGSMRHELFRELPIPVAYVSKIMNNNDVVFELKFSDLSQLATRQLTSHWLNDILNLKNTTSNQASLDAVTNIMRVAINQPMIRTTLWKSLCEQVGLDVRNERLYAQLIELLSTTQETAWIQAIRQAVEIEGYLRTRIEELEQTAGAAASMANVADTFQTIMPGNLVMHLESRDRLGAGHAQSFIRQKNSRVEKRYLEELKSVVQDIIGCEIDAFERDKAEPAEFDIGSFPALSTGSGIQSCVIMLWDIVNQPPGTIILTEEPENSMHPLLVKKLVHYFASDANRQYFLATHSAHLIDTNSAILYRVDLENNETKVTLALTDRTKSAICDELGFRASDLLQSSCLLWVEGPSDRIYLRHWITSKAPELVEGLHYSIMFYGGALRSHLSVRWKDDPEDANDAEVSDFIQLLKINKNSMMLLDSDKDQEPSDLNEHKKRIQAELSDGTGFAWVTKGRTIENYINHQIMYAAIKKKHPKSNVPSITDDPYCKAFRRAIRIKKRDQDDINTSTEPEYEDVPADKVKVAQHIVLHNEADFSMLDLQDQINMTVKFIRLSNGLPT